LVRQEVILESFKHFGIQKYVEKVVERLRKMGKWHFPCLKAGVIVVY
jgi:hypothetical protein